MLLGGVFDFDWLAAALAVLGSTVRTLAPRLTPDTIERVEDLFLADDQLSGLVPAGASTVLSNTFWVTILIDSILSNILGVDRDSVKPVVQAVLQALEGASFVLSDPDP